jgi:pseudaminic acid synthase
MFKINNSKFGFGYKPMIIAEISANHNGSLKRAIKIVKKAAECGVDAIKLQTYTPDTMTLNSKKKDFFINDKKSLWYGKSLYDLYKQAYTPWEWHKTLFREARKLGLIYFSTPFDDTSVNFLKKFNLPIYKISSFENTDLRLIKLVAKTKKPMIISLGMANYREIKEAVFTARKYGCKKLVLLKCTSAYPAKHSDANLTTIPFLRKKFKCEVGISDHTMGISVALAATALRASVIEKHFTLSRKDGGPDAKFSLEPDELKSLVKEVKNVWSSLGKIKLDKTKSEEKNLKFKRSIYVSEDIEKGDQLSKNNIRIIRPGYGIKSKYYDNIIGKIAVKKILRGTALKFSYFK